MIRKQRATLSKKVVPVTEEAKRILELLPELIRQDESFRDKLWRVLDTEFSSKAELSRVLEQIEKSRQESNRRFEASDERFRELLAELRSFREETSRRFEATDRRFEASDERFRELLAELRSFKAEANQRFEASDERFDAIDTRFDAVDRRLDAVDRRLDDHDKRFDRIERKLDDQKDWVNVVVGGFQNRAGRSLEDAIAGTLRIALKMTDVDPARIRMRQKIVDASGKIGPAGRTYEVDIVVSNGESWIFEVKSVAEETDVYRFNDAAELAIELLGLPGAHKALITLTHTDEVRELCRQLGVVLA